MKTTDKYIKSLLTDLGFEFRQRRRFIGKGKSVGEGEKIWISKCHGCEIDVDKLTKSLEEVRSEALKEGREEALIDATLFTGILVAKSFEDVQRKAEELLDRPIYTHEFANKELWEQLKAKVMPELKKKGGK